MGAVKPYEAVHVRLIVDPDDNDGFVGRVPIKVQVILLTPPIGQRQVASIRCCAVPEFQEVKSQLSGQLMSELKEQNDPRVIDEQCRFEQAPFTDWPIQNEDMPRRIASIPDP